MKTYYILGEPVGPDIIVVARTPEEAKAAYNSWLNFKCGRCNDAALVKEIPLGHLVVVPSNSTVYGPPGAAVSLLDQVRHTCHGEGNFHCEACQLEIRSHWNKL